MRIVLTFLTVVAALSPLLTFVRLWQVKEWRFDRLREHLRREGWFLQLFGWVKPIVFGAGLVSFAIISLLTTETTIAHFALYSVPALLAWFTLFRLVIGRQARPVWTKKAVAVTGMALLFFGTVAWILAGREEYVALIVLAAVPLFSFTFGLVALVLLTPLDRLFKWRILSRASTVRQRFKDLTVIGITGSVGKTMTKELLAHILSDRKLLVTPAHVNTELGVASLMLKNLSKEHQIFIVEMGAYCRGEIAFLCELTKPGIGIITFIGKQHLGLFGSQEELCRAKGELFASLPPSGHAFLNADTEYCEHLMQRASCPVHTVGTGGHATYEAFEIEETDLGVAFTLRGEHIAVPLPGTHHVTNVLLAIAAAETLGVPIAESAKRLQSFKGLPQTFEKKEGKSGQLVLDDTHNASPESFRAAIEWARSSSHKKKLLVTSGLLELGKDEGTIHRELGMLCRDVFGEVVFLNKNCVRDFEQGYGKTVRVFPKKKFKVVLKDDMLVVCEGRMPERVIEGLLL